MRQKYRTSFTSSLSDTKALSTLSPKTATVWTRFKGVEETFLQARIPFQSPNQQRQIHSFIQMKIRR